MKKFLICLALLVLVIPRGSYRTIHIGGWVKYTKYIRYCGMLTPDVFSYSTSIAREAINYYCPVTEKNLAPDNSKYKIIAVTPNYLTVEVEDE